MLETFSLEDNLRDQIDNLGARWLLYKHIQLLQLGWTFDPLVAFAISVPAPGLDY